MHLFTKNIIKERKKIISLITIFFMTNNLIAIASENKANFLNIGIIDNNFEKIENSDSILFNEYDYFENQLRTFFGFYSVESEKSYFQDLSIMNESKAIRQIYKTKLNDMTIDKNTNIIKR